MSNQWVNFAAIKESVDIDQVLEHLDAAAVP